MWAAQGEIILGYLLIKDGDGEVMWMDVLAAWPKGTGVGRRLMDHCEAFLQVPGVKRNAVSIPMSSISGPWKFTANEAM